MKTSNRLSLPADPKNRRSCLCNLPTASLLCVIFFVGSMFVTTDFKESFTRWGMVDDRLITEAITCKNQCRPQGSEALPKGIVVRTSNLELRPLWGPPMKKNPNSKNLLAIAVGIRQKENVDKMVKKFPPRKFAVMLFHYDGMVDEWSDLEWSPRAVHVSAINQTKWWFAKRFLHPDIVAEYDYIFLWDEDLGVENFNPRRYLSIIKEEGLEISQPALDAAKSEVHHQITARGRRSKVHRRTYKVGRGSGSGCDANSTAPPCTGWVEMMAPVFSRASWRCTWYMIQNDLIHGWGLDFQLGYCAQGDRTKNIGVVDAEYIIHQGLPTLGGLEENTTTAEAPGQSSPTKLSANMEAQAPSHAFVYTDRYAVRKRSYIELEIFKYRWKMAKEEDQCWIDPFQQSTKQ